MKFAVTDNSLAAIIHRNALWDRQGRTMSNATRAAADRRLLIKLLLSLKNAPGVLAQLELQAGDTYTTPEHTKMVDGCRCGNTRLADELTFARAQVATR